MPSVQLEATCSAVPIDRGASGCLGQPDSPDATHRGLDLSATSSPATHPRATDAAAGSPFAAMQHAPALRRFCGWSLPRLRPSS